MAANLVRARRAARQAAGLLWDVNALRRGTKSHTEKRLVYEQFLPFANSGDLAPLAHLALPLIGRGHVEYRGQVYGGVKPAD